MFRVDAKYVWYDKGTRIVLMYFLNNVPFSFDPAYEADDFLNYDVACQSIINLADSQPRYEVKDVYNGCRYLINEMAHPCFNEIDIENPEILPDDICGTGHDIIDYY